MSPQKRVTRARAAAKKAGDDPKPSTAKADPKSSTRKRSESMEEKSKERAMPVVNEPLRKSARRVVTSAPSRRIKITPINSKTSSQHPPQQQESSLETVPKPRATRSKEATLHESNVDEVETIAEPPKPKRQASGVNKAKDTTKAIAPKPRGRPKKAEVVQDEAMMESENAQEQNKTRTFPGASKTRATRALAVAPSKTTIPKKRVTFQDLPEWDKENQPVPQARETAKGKSTIPASGIRAKPVRRPAARSKATSKQDTTTATAEATAQRVLTPKKLTQVVKSFSSVYSDEDELNGAKTPIRDLSQSPRRNVNIARTGSPVKKLDFGGESLASSPVKSQLTSTLLSPAKRPVPSPFKDALKESPKRGDFFPKLSQLSNSNEVAKAGDQTSCSSMMLLQSPKRVALGTPMFPQSTSKACRSPFKASLLQSPPKRPVSPMKPSSTVQAMKGPATPTKGIDADTMSPDVTVSSHLRASKSPDRSSRAHRVTPEEAVEEVRCAIDFDESVVDIRSPLKLANTIANVFDQDQEDSHDYQIIGSDPSQDCLMAQVTEDPVLQNDEPTKAEDSSTTQMAEAAVVRTTAPSSIMLQNQTPVNAASFLFRASRLRDDDESSEDELQSPVKMFQTQTPVTVQGNKPSLSLTNRVGVEQNPGFTPLAAQLSGWLASSPDNKPARKTRPRGIFSPIAAQHVPGEVIIDRHSPATSRLSTGRLSMTARQSIGSRKLVAHRSSLAISMTGSPDKSTYFADEMVVKDLEEAIESMQAKDQECGLRQQAKETETVDGTLVEHISEEVDEEVANLQEQEDGDGTQPPELPKKDCVADAPDEAFHTLLPEPEAGTSTEEDEDRQQIPETSQNSTASSAYGDENVVPATPAEAVSVQVLRNAQESSNTPAVLASTSNRAPFNEFITPSRPQRAAPQFANTVVSKVPLRPEGHISPIKVPKKRSRSLSSGPSSVKKTPVLQSSGISQSRTVNTFSPAPQSNLNTPYSVMTTPGQQSFAIDDFGDSTLDGIQIDDDDENLPPVTPTAASVRSFAMIPSKTLKGQTPAAPSGVLQGAVVFVDVHTTEGAEASGIFVELLTQMGAKCVRNWSWNPRASMGVNTEDATATPGGGKIGITHVVYKDGGKRTLEKVRDTEGVVKCVGVGWVLE